MKTTLLANGDSWTFGSEIMAPEFLAAGGEKGYGMGNRYKKDREDWREYNNYYRIPRIWPTIVGNILEIPNVVNISRPARSNDTIYDTTIQWILENYISKNRNTDELLVVVGWSSPERKNIMLGDSGIENDSTLWMTLWPNTPDTTFYQSPVIKEFFKFYVMHQWIEQEYIKRYVEQNYQLQTFCKAHNIDCFVFNSFYAAPNTGPEGWKDISIPDVINKWDNLVNGWGDNFYSWNSIKESLLTQWNLLDKKFVNKDHPDGSFRSYIYKNVDKKIRMCNWHPSPESHKAWAFYLANYIEANK